MRRSNLRLYLGVLGVLLVCGWGCGHPHQGAGSESPENETLFQRDNASPEVALASYQEPLAFTKHPDVKAAIQQSKFPIYQGDSPPQLQATFALAGLLTEASSSGRAVGSTLTSGIFLDTQDYKGQARFRTCEKSQLISDGYIPITGLSERSFTLYVTWKLPEQQCRIFGLFSGTKASDGWKVEAMVIYEKSCKSSKVGWERSKQTWTDAAVDCRPPDASYRPPTPLQAGCTRNTNGLLKDRRNPQDPINPTDPIDPRPPAPSPSCSPASPNCPNPGADGNGANPPTPPGSGSGNPPSPGSGSGGSGTPGGASGSGSSGSSGSPGRPSGSGGGSGGMP